MSWDAIESLNYELTRINEDLMYETAVSFVYTLSSSIVLKSLGYGDYFKEVLQIVKLLAGDLATYLTTGKYINGLAAELGEHAKKLWEVNFDDYELLQLIYELLDLKKKVEVGEADVETSKNLLYKLINLLEVDVNKTNVIKKIFNNPQPELVLQFAATAFVISVGGLNGSKFLTD